MSLFWLPACNQMCSQNNSTECAAISKPKVHPSSLLSGSSSCCCPYLSGVGRGAATPQLCSADHARKGVCGPKLSSPRALQVSAAGSLIKATLLVLTHVFPLLSCPFLQSASCTKLLFPSLQCRPKAVSHIREAAPVLASDKDCYLHWLRRGFHPCAHQ